MKEITIVVVVAREEVVDLGVALGMAKGFSVGGNRKVVSKKTITIFIVVVVVRCGSLFELTSAT